jgi:hypothetical protein
MTPVQGSAAQSIVMALLGKLSSDSAAFEPQQVHVHASMHGGSQV